MNPTMRALWATCCLVFAGGVPRSSYEVPRCDDASIPVAACVPREIPVCTGAAYSTTSQARTLNIVRRLDYQALPYLVKNVKLAIDLSARVTVVDAELEIYRSDASEPITELVLNGSPDMHLVLLTIDNGPTEELSNATNTDYVCLNHTDWTVRVGVASAFEDGPSFNLKTRVLLTPNTNTHLFGLYESNGLLLTQNEAEGFRRITYFPDRPDVLSVYNVTLIADKNEYPVLLSNGEKTATGEIVEADGTVVQWATFVDPWPKPCYLFALVAGNLTSISKPYRIGRPCVEAVAAFYDVSIEDAVNEPLHRYCDAFPTEWDGLEQATLSIWGEPGLEARLEWALDSLEKAMLWDEIKFGRFYDLPEFHVVAAKDFNAGAMENKGLNIFNEALILADPQLTTDVQYLRIQGVIAHEYFHNWSGDRVTVRDWFQLSLKEGFTVFRDQEFTEDITKSSVKRVDDAKFLQDVQYREDAGPLAHPARPEEYASIENFYTVTVYEKGAEIVRMYKTLLGWKNFRRATDHYFEAHDGHAATLEDFLESMEAASGEDLKHFFQWYFTAGTPVVRVSGRRWHRRNDLFELTLRQTVSGNSDPLLIPISVGFLSKEGARDVIPTQVLRLSEAEQTFWISNITEPVIPTMNRGFSAPIIIAEYLTSAELVHQANFDSCGYIQWQAGQALMKRAVLKELTHVNHNPNDLLSVVEGVLLKVLEGGADFALSNDMAGMAFRLKLPPTSAFEDDLAVFDPTVVFESRQRVRRRISLFQRELLWETFTLLDGLVTRCESHNMTTNQIGVRFLRNEILSLLAAVSEDPEAARVVYEQLTVATHENEAAAALYILSNFPPSELRSKGLHAYRVRADSEDLLVNRWLSAQASSTAVDTAERVGELVMDPEFQASRTPNRIRALVGSFAGNVVALNADEGAGYKLVADEVLRIDQFNPKVAARIAKAFTLWAKYPNALKRKIVNEIERLLAAPTLSMTSREILSKAASAGQLIDPEQSPAKIPSAEL